MKDGGRGGSIPTHRVIVLPWLKRVMQRFVLKDWTAITIGHRIFSWRGLDEVELAHELTHVRQWQKYGVSFVGRYFMASRRASKGGGNRYFDNEFEREAAVAGEAARKREGDSRG
ncbi:MAG: hypothetical protein ABIP53_07055 [Candidatus Limnocylindrales bacterium]